MKEKTIAEMFEQLKKDDSWEEDRKTRMILAEGLKEIIISL